MRRSPPAATLLALAMLAALHAAPVAAQLAVELRGGAAVGNYHAAAAGLEALPRRALAVLVEHAATPLLAPYVGYSRATFGCRDGFCRGTGTDFTSAGVVAGVRLRPARLPWVRVGALYHALRTEREGTPTRRSSSGYGPGLELGGGVSIPVARLRVVPGVTYRAHAVPSAGASDRVAILSAELGLRLGL